MSAQTKAERHVSSAVSDGGRGSTLVDKIKGGAYSDEQYRSLSTEEKRRVQKYREEGKKKKNTKTKERREKRKLAKLKAKENGSDDDEEVADKEATPSSSAGAQFGANGNKIKKPKA